VPGAGTDRRGLPQLSLPLNLLSFHFPFPIQVLIFVCRNCGYKEDAPPSAWCVYRNEITHSARERTVFIQDVRADPTLPCTRDAACPACGHEEAVFFSSPSEEGMTLYFTCTGCGHRWRDYV